MYDFSICKFCEAAEAVAKYRIQGGRYTIFCCPSCGGHYIDHLDDVQADPNSTACSRQVISQSDFDYIDKELQSNTNRFRDKVDLLLRSCESSDLDILDVGAGGGLFIHLLKEHGVSAHGIEPSAVRCAFARERYGLELSSRLIDDTHWQDGFSGYFDAVTMWDVIEHVNFPKETLLNANKLLKKDGLLLLDTPMRDALYYRAGMMSYKLTMGKFPTFLNVMYARGGSHKQIFSTKQLVRLLERCGFEVIDLRKIHELSFPYAFYLKRLLHSEKAGNLLDPFARLFFKIAKIRNKMVVVAKAKRES